MLDHSGRPDLVCHQIPDMAGKSLKSLILSIAAECLATRSQARALKKTPKRVLMEIFSAPRNEASFIQGLQHLSAAFAAACNDEDDLPEKIGQVQWNRYMRDQSERLRAAALTVGRGHDTVARTQLEPMVAFIDRHFEAMKA